MKRAFQYSLKYSFPIFVSFIPIGIAYGMMMNDAGFNFLWTGLVDVLILAGTCQFTMIDAMAGEVPLLTIAILAFLINSRMTFYGITMIEKYKDSGKAKPLLIYTLVDETYMLDCSQNPWTDVDPKKCYIWYAILVPVYWLITTIAGALLGAIIPFSTEGIDFAINAMFIAICLNMLKDAKNPLPAVFSVGTGLICRFIFGPTGFMLPTLIITVLLMIVFRKQIETPLRKEAQNE